MYYVANKVVFTGVQILRDPGSNTEYNPDPSTYMCGDAGMPRLLHVQYMNRDSGILTDIIANDALNIFFYLHNSLFAQVHEGNGQVQGLNDLALPHIELDLLLLADYIPLLRQGLAVADGDAGAALRATARPQHSDLLSQPRSLVFTI